MDSLDPGWNCVAGYEISGLSDSKIDVAVYRGPQDQLAWGLAKSDNFELNPASLEINPKQRNAVLRLDNLMGMDVSITIPFKLPLPVPDGSIDSRVAVSTGKPYIKH